MPRIIPVLCSLLLVGTAIANDAQPLTDPEVARMLGVAQEAMEAAHANAKERDSQGLTDSLKRANEAWQRFHKRFRDMPSPDSAWKANCDAINESMLNAGAALSRNESMGTIENHLQQAISTLEGLKARNGIPDYETPMEKMAESLDKVAKTLEQGRGMALSDDEAAQLKEVIAQLRDKFKELDSDAQKSPDKGLDQTRALLPQGIDELEKALKSRNRFLAKAAIRRFERKLKIYELSQRLNESAGAG